MEFLLNFFFRHQIFIFEIFFDFLTKQKIITELQKI